MQALKSPVTIIASNPASCMSCWALLRRCAISCGEKLIYNCTSLEHILSNRVSEHGSHRESIGGRTVLSIPNCIQKQANLLYQIVFLLVVVREAQPAVLGDGRSLVRAPTRRSAPSVRARGPVRLRLTRMARLSNLGARVRAPGRIPPTNRVVAEGSAPGQRRTQENHLCDIGSRFR